MDIIDREYRSVPHEDKLYSRLVMSTDIRQARLQANQDMRNNPGCVKDLSFGRWALAIPQLDHYYLLKKYPDLGSPDKDIKDKALARFLASSESAPYKVIA